jgi:hypothetical protein
VTMIFRPNGLLTRDMMRRFHITRWKVGHA